MITAMGVVIAVTARLEVTSLVEVTPAAEKLVICEPQYHNTAM